MRKIDEELLIALLSKEDDFNQFELATLFNVDQSTISYKLKKLGLHVSPSSSLQKGRASSEPVYIICPQCQQHKKYFAKGLCQYCYNINKEKEYYIIHNRSRYKVREEEESLEVLTVLGYSDDAIKRIMYPYKKVVGW